MDAQTALTDVAAGELEAPRRAPSAREIRELAQALLAAADDSPQDQLETPGDLAGAFLRGYKPGSETRKAYARDLAVLFLWLRHRGTTPFGATRAHISDWIAQPRPNGQPFKPATIARRLSCASGFYAYAVDENLIARNPTLRLRRPRFPDTATSLGVGKRDARALLRAADADPRAAVLIRLLLENGLRVSEAVGIDIEDIGRESDFDVIKLKGKGEDDKQTNAPLNAATKAAIDRLASGRDSGPLLATRSGRRLTRQDAYKIVRKLCRDAGIPELGPHSLRHSFVTLALDDGASLRDVQDAARHKDPRTTRRYDQGRNSLKRHPTHRLLGLLED